MKLDPAAYATVDWASLHVGDDLPVARQEVDLADVVMGAATTSTYFGGHIDPAYAHRQARRGVYFATGTVAGVLDRYVSAWAGPGAFLRSRRVAMRDSICAGDSIELSGMISELRTEVSSVACTVPETVGLVVVDVTITNQLGATCVTCRSTLQVPLAPDSGGT